MAIEGVHSVPWTGEGRLPGAPWGSGRGLLQWNLSASDAGVLRGMHLHGACDELYLLLEGAMEAGLYDLRPGSPTAGCSAHFAVAALGQAITVPAGVLHGLLFTRPSLLLTGRTTEHDGADEWRCRWDDPALGLRWSLEQPLLSPEDAGAGGLEALRDWASRAPAREDAA